MLGSTFRKTSESPQVIFILPSYRKQRAGLELISERLVGQRKLLITGPVTVDVGSFPVVFLVRSNVIIQHKLKGSGYVCRYGFGDEGI